MTSADRASYQGRRLPRPTEEVVDQGLGFDLGTLLHRRSVLAATAAGAAAIGLVACGVQTSSSATSSGGSAASSSTSGISEIPDETAGPYPGDGSNGPDVLAESGIVREDLRTSFGTGSATADGVGMELELSIFDLADSGRPFEGAAVYVWHCDRDGNYSMYSTGVEGENYLRGVQIADSAGKVRFTSIFPACYSGRWPHIHFEVYPGQASIADSTKAIAVSQVALPEDPCAKVYSEPGYEQSSQNMARVTLDSDNVFSDDAGASQLATVSGSVGNGYRVSLDLGVDATTAVTGGGAPGGGPR
jgi:protocatechuate 3,4-dioxygenase beta subunit